MNDELVEVYDSLYSAIVFSPADWGADKRKAWIYGIVVGWDDASLKDLKERFKWDSKTIERLKRLHTEVQKYK